MAFMENTVMIAEIIKITFYGLCFLAIPIGIVLLSILLFHIHPLLFLGFILLILSFIVGFVIRVCLED